MIVKPNQLINGRPTNTKRPEHFGSGLFLNSYIVLFFHPSLRKLDLTTSSEDRVRQKTVVLSNLHRVRVVTSRKLRDGVTGLRLDHL